MWTMSWDTFRRSACCTELNSFNGLPTSNLSDTF